MANTRFYVVEGQSTADTSTFDLTTGAETSRSPTGAIVFVSYPTALDTDTTHAGLGFGVTDFTTTEAYFQSCEDGQTTSDSHREKGATGDIAFLNTAGAAALDRAFTSISAITGGIRITPGASGTQYRFMAVLVFGSACSAHSTGDNTGENLTYNLAHGFSTAPKFGFFARGNWVTDNVGYNPTMGFMTYIASTIKQRAFNAVYRHNEADGFNGTREVYTDRVNYDSMQQFDGTEDHSTEVTAVDATNVTLTHRTANVVHQRGDMLALLVECDDVDVFLDTIDSPNSAASDWDVTVAPWRPQFAMSLTSLSDSEAAGGATNWDAAIGGAHGVSAFDKEGSIFSLSTHNEQAAATSNCQSRLSQALYMHLDDGTVAYNMNNPSFASTGFSFASADITTANATTHKWPTIFVEDLSVGGAAYHRRLMGT